MTLFAFAGRKVNLIPYFLLWDFDSFFTNRSHQWSMMCVKKKGNLQRKYPLNRSYAYHFLVLTCTVLQCWNFYIAKFVKNSFLFWTIKLYFISLPTIVQEMIKLYVWMVSFVAYLFSVIWLHFVYALLLACKVNNWSSGKTLGASYIMYSRTWYTQQWNL